MNENLVFFLDCTVVKNQQINVLLRRRHCVLLISLYLVTKNGGYVIFELKKNLIKTDISANFPVFLRNRLSEPGDHSILWLTEWSTEQFKDCELTKPTYTLYEFNMTIF